MCIRLYTHMALRHPFLCLELFTFTFWISFDLDRSLRLHCFLSNYLSDFMTSNIIYTSVCPTLTVTRFLPILLYDPLPGFFILVFFLTFLFRQFAFFLYIFLYDPSRRFINVSRFHYSVCAYLHYQVFIPYLSRLTCSCEISSLVNIKLHSLFDPFNFKIVERSY